MSYCVNCGVELAKGEKVCPLCDTEVLNPREPWDENVARPYPEKREKITRVHIDRKFLTTLIGVIFLIAIATTAVCDLLYWHAITWSAYVIGGGCCLFLAVAPPIYIGKKYGIFCVLIDGLASVIYLFIIERLSGGDWFWDIGLPVTLAATLATAAVVIILKRFKPTVLIAFAEILFFCGILCVLIDMIILSASGAEAFPRWSLCVLTPCVVLGIAAIVAEKSKKLKDEIKRRLFF